MSKQTLITKETAYLVPLGSVAPAAPGDVAGLEEELAERRSEAEAAETEITSLNKSYDDEVADHLETTKRAFAADKTLVDLWNFLNKEWGIGSDPSEFFSDNVDVGESELRDAIIAAQTRVKAAEDAATARAEVKFRLGKAA